MESNPISPKQDTRSNEHGETSNQTIRMPSSSMTDTERTVRMPNHSSVESEKTVRIDLPPEQTIRMTDEGSSSPIQTIRMPVENHLGMPTAKMDSESDNPEKTVRMVDPQQTLAMSADQALAASNANHLQGQRRNGYIQIGDFINEKYRIVQNLTYNTGEATLFICEYEQATFVAKVYHQNMKPKDEVSERIHSIQSDYVIPVLEAGMDEQSGRYYEILPYYQKGDLSKRSNYDPQFILNVIAPALNEGIHAIHEAGVVHRDIKPNNLFFSNDGTSIIIGDFGISSTLDQGSVVFTGNANRTNGYAAPEVYNRLICKESDFYSIGITLLELVLGENPFRSLTEEQIMKMTLMDPLEIPSFIPERLSHLIKGLTRKDRNIRWGYEEVKKWLNGEHVHIAEDTYNRNIRAYRFAGKEIQSLEELTLTFANHWEEAKKHLYRGLVRDFVSQFGEEFELIVIECEENRNQDLGLHQMITRLHPYPPLCWKGNVYYDLQEIGKAMKSSFPGINHNIYELLTNHLFLQYLQRLEIEKENQAFFAEVRNIDQITSENPHYAYFLLAFLLLEEAVFSFHGHDFRHVNELITYLHEHRDIIDELAAELIQSQYFYAWLTYNGYEQHLDEWRAVI